MDLTQTYKSFGDFWTSISLVVYANLVVLLGLRYIVGIRFQPFTRLNEYLQTPAGKRRKRLLDDLGVWTKMPFVAVLALLFYLTIFSSTTNLVLQLGGTTPWIGLNVGHLVRWQETHREPLLVSIALYDRNLTRSAAASQQLDSPKERLDELGIL